MAMLRKNRGTEMAPRKNDDGPGLTPWTADPWFAGIDEWFDGMRREFERTWGLRPGRFLGSGDLPAVRVPALDVRDEGADLVVTADLPGVRKEDLEIQVTEDGLEIGAQTRSDREEKDGMYVYRERTASSFRRTVALPVQVSADKVVADLKDGVLEVRLPKQDPTPRAKPVKVKVQ